MIVNLSEFDPAWVWHEHAFSDRPGTHWAHETDRRVPFAEWLPRRLTLARAAAGWRAAGYLQGDDAVLVTHGPRPTMYGALAAQLRRRERRHLAFSFNFTDLPTGSARKLMAAAYRHVDRFVVFSTMERTLYAKYFDLPLERFDMLHWGVQPPALQAQAAPLEAGDYVCAIGSQARDYALLFETMRSLPSIRLVVVATPQSLHGLSVPENVRVHTNIPLADAMNILAFSRFMVLPLRSSEVPCGHVTLVAAMHLGKAIVSTDSSGVSDYVKKGSTGELVASRDPTSMSRAIQALYDDPDTAVRLGAAGLSFARVHCCEQNTIDYFARYLAD